METAIRTGVGLLAGGLQNRGSNANAGANREAAQYAQGIYDDAQSNFQPYLGIGQTGLTGLQALAGGDYSGFMNSPDFKARVSFANEQFNDGAASKFRLFSGGAQNDRDALNQNLAAQGLGDWRNFNMGLAGMGMQGASQLGAIGSNSANTFARSMGAYGDARQSAYGNLSDTATGLGGMFSSWYGNNSARNGGGSGWYLGNNPGRG